MRFCYSCMHQFNNKSAKVCPACGEPLEWTSDTNAFLKPGTVLQSKFIVGKVLGSGGFGNTYIGWNNLLQQKVAIKEYYPRQLSGRGKDGVTVTFRDGVAAQRFRIGLRRFLEEARSLAALQSVKGIIRIYNFFEENGTGYIVMEFLEGMDLKGILQKNNGIMEYRKARQVILTVLHTLKEIHQYGILHRDIAPDNVFVTKEGIIKLIDFGAAKHASKTEAADAEIVLKVGYAPIEQYSNSAQQGTYTDVYEVAALFYRMLTGKKPQPANERVSDDRVKAFSDLRIIVPEKTELAVMCCLNVKPQYRLQTAGEFMEALGGADFQPIYEPEWILPPVEEIPESPVALISERLRKLPVVGKVGLALLILALLGAGGYGIKILTEQNGIGVMAGNGKTIRIPAGCINHQEQEVLDKLEESGLKADVVYNMAEGQNQPSADGTVIDIDPKEGQKISQNDKVKLIVASTGKVTIPDLVGKKGDEIVKTLKEAIGQIYNEEMLVYSYNKKIEQDVCYNQTLAAGETADKKTVQAMKVFVSWGDKRDYMKKMPALNGKTVEEAREALEQAGIDGSILSVRKREYSNTPAGGITAQSVGVGEMVNTNKQDTMHQKHIQVTVSRGPKPKPSKSPKKTPKPTRTATPRPKPTAQRPAEIGYGDIEIY